jgi:hypothetical protein
MALAAQLDCTQKLHFSLEHRWHFFRQLGATLRHHAEQPAAIRQHGRQEGSG